MIVLTRFASSPVQGTFGRMVVDGVSLYTVECPWLGNQPYVSCIPAGVYACRPRRYFSGGYDAIEITNVPYRSHILFHRANRASDLRGCVGTGRSLGCLAGDWAVLNSREAHDYIMERLGETAWQLKVEWEVFDGDHRHNNN